MYKNRIEKTTESTIDLLSVKRLCARWQVSPRTVRRLVDDGLLRQVRLRGRVGYFWPDVWACEGGQPPEGEAGAYRAPLLTPEQVAARCPFKPSTLKTYAKKGLIPHRRVGAKIRFVPAEIDRWLSSSQGEDRSKNGYSGQNSGFDPNKPRGT